jgi:hypothetical protein
MTGPCRANGERLIGASEMSADFLDFQLWRRKRQAWTEATTCAVATEYGLSAAREFERVTREVPSDGHWAEDLALEVARVREGLEMLHLLEASTRIRA